MITHLLKKDIRHARAPLAIWLLLILLQCVLVGAGLNPGDRVMQVLFQTIAAILPFFQGLLLLVIIPYVVQDEPLVGTTAFWFTRPISRTALLKTKILFIALVLVALPLAAQVVVLAANGVTPGDISLAVPEIVMNQLWWILIVAVLAVITPNFGKFAIAGAVFGVVCVLALMVMQWLRLFLNPEYFMAQMQNFSLEKSRSVAGTLVTILAGCAVVFHQYLTRKTARSIIAIGLGFAAIIVVQNWWPWDFLKPVPVKGGDTAFDAASLKIALGSSPSLSDVASIRNQGAAKKSIQAEIDTQGAPAAYVIQPRDVDPSLKTADGQPVPMEQNYSSGFFFGGQLDPNAMEAALGGTPILNENNGRNYMPPVMLGSIDADVCAKYADQPLVFSADIDFLASKYVLEAEMPLVKGSRYDRGSVHAVITDVLKQPDGVEILLRVRRVLLLFDRNNASNSRLASDSEMNVVWLLLNKKRNEAIVQKQSNSFNMVVNQSILSNQPVDLSFGQDQNRPGLVPDITPEWLAGAELVRLELVPVSEYSKHLVVDKFLLNGKSAVAFRNNAEIRPDVDALAKITLPENATKQQVREYIDSIIIASRNQNQFSDRDPQIAMLDKIGPENLDVLIESAGRLAGAPGNYYMTGAIQELARPDDKALVLQALPDQHDLVELVVKFGWQADARDTLVSQLAKNSGYLPEKWIKAVALLQDPSTYPSLEAYLLHGSNRVETFQAIKDLPGIDLTATVDELWKKSRHDNSYEVLSSCEIAGQYGHLDALETLAGILKEEKNQSELKHACELFQKLTPATGDKTALLAWFDANKGKLVFDPQTKTFIPAK